MKNLTKKKLVVFVICGLVIGLTAVSLIAFAIRQKNESAKYNHKSTFEPITATVACCSDNTSIFLLDLSAEYYDTVYSVSANQLRKIGIQPGDFAEMTFSVNVILGCEGKTKTVTDIASAQKIPPTKALAQRGYELIPENHHVDAAQFQIYQNQEADFIMFSVNGQIYAYTPDSDEPMIFENTRQTLDYFNIEIPEPTDPELTCPYTLKPYYFKSDEKDNSLHNYSTLLTAKDYQKEKKRMPEELQNFIDQTWNGTDGMFIMERRNHFELTDEATIYFPHEYSGLFNLWAGHGNPVDYAVLYIEADEFQIMYDKFFGRD